MLNRNIYVVFTIYYKSYSRVWTHLHISYFIFLSFRVVVLPLVSDFLFVLIYLSARWLTWKANGHVNHWKLAVKSALALLEKSSLYKQRERKRGNKKSSRKKKKKDNHESGKDVPRVKALGRSRTPKIMGWTFEWRPTLVKRSWNGSSVWRWAASIFTAFLMNGSRIYLEITCSVNRRRNGGPGIGAKWRSAKSNDNVVITFWTFVNAAVLSL